MEASFYNPARETGLAAKVAAFIGERLGHDSRRLKVYLPDGSFDTAAAFRLLVTAAGLDGALTMDGFIKDNIPDGFEGFLSERDFLRKAIDGAQGRFASEGLLGGTVDKRFAEIRLKNLDRFLFLEAAAGAIDRVKASR